MLRTMMPTMPADIRRCCLVPFFAFLCAFTAWAQTSSTGGLTVTVKDASGAVVPHGYRSPEQ